MICPYCKEEIKDGSIKCKYCKSTLYNDSDNSMHNLDNISSNIIKKGYIGYAIVSLILGILLLLGALTNDEKLDKDMITGFLFICSIALVLGIVTIKNKYEGAGMAIAGITTSILSAIILFS